MSLWKSDIGSHLLDVQEASVSHSSTESEIISLDARVANGWSTLDLWDVVIEVSRSSNSAKTPTNPAAGICSRNHKSKQNENSSQGESQLYIFEGNEAVIQMIMNARSPTMRHVRRTHRVALEWLFDRINLDPMTQIKYVDTKDELTDMFDQRKFHS